MRNADFVLYNTCTVRENANLRVYGRLGVSAQPQEKESAHDDRPLRLHDAGSRTVVEKFKKSYRFVDLDFRHPQHLSNWQSCWLMRFETDGRWSSISGKIRIRSWKICRQSGNIPSSPASTSCLAATISAATVSYRMCADGSAAVKPEDIIREIEAAGYRRRRGSHAVRTECKFLRKESGAAHDICRTSATGRTD